MSIIQGHAKSASRGFYPNPIDQSLRFNDDDSAYLSRTPASAGNQKTWTISFWIKRANIDALQWIYLAGSDTWARFDANGQLTFNNRNGGTNYFLTFAPQFRDVSAWYHFVIACDTTQATDSNRFKLYVNGEQITELDTLTTYPPQNHDTEMNEASLHRFFGYSSGLNYFDGYCAEFHFTDGTAYTADAFGEFKENIWVAKAPSVTYGTNGFYLDFANSADIGNDVSGEGNDWTPNNFTASDVVLDSPTDNFATLNPLANSGLTLSDGNLDFYSNGGNRDTVVATIAVSSGKWYWEVTAVTFTGHLIGVVPADYYPLPDSRIGLDDDGIGWRTDIANLYYDGAQQESYGSSLSNGDVVGVALDLDGDTIEWFKNGVSLGSKSFTFTGAYAPAVSDPSNVNQCQGSINFGQQDFTYTPPSGYLALSTANLPDPAIDPAQGSSPQDYFNTVLYTGDGTSSHAITGVGFQPDLNWTKSRSTADFHMLNDVIRGVNTSLNSNATNAEFVDTDRFLSFDSDGFTVGADATLNGSGKTYVSWNWKANGSGVSNTEGSITSTVSANTESGFSIVSYTTLANTVGTVGHGLGVVPDMVIAKTRSSSAAWNVWHKDILISQRLRLDDTSAATSSAVWNSTLPTSDVFTQNISTTVQTAIAYCFHSVEGFSKCSSYVGNGSNDGPFVYCGFRPAFIIIKNVDAVKNWYMFDDTRQTYNVLDDLLAPNLSDAETSNTGTYLDILSNGFKLRQSFSHLNTSGQDCIFMAFASNPFKYSNAR